MATGTGLDAQLGMVVETTYGTGATVTRFLPLVSETMKKDINQSESGAQIAGAQVLRSTQWKQGNATVSGDLSFEMYDQSMGMALRACFGTVNTSGTAAPYTHNFFPAAPSVSLTCQVGRPTTYGTVTPFTYTGVKPQSWELAASAGEIVTFSMSVIAQEEAMGTAIAAPSYAANLTPWHARYGTLSIDGTLVPVPAFKVGGNNNLTDGRRYLGSTVIAEPLRGDLAEYTGEFTAEWGNVGTAAATYGTALYGKFLAGSEATLVYTMAAGTLSGTVTANVRFDGSTPNVGDRGIIMQTVPFKCIASGTLDSNAISVTIKNNDTTA